MKRWVWITLALLVTVEATLRALHETGRLPLEAKFQADLFQHDAVYGHILPPSSHTNFKYRRRHMDVPVEINTYGYRDAQMTRDKKPGTFRIATLGDSVTFGWEVLEPQTYPRQLENLLRAAHPNVEVFNFGVPGYTSYSGLKILENQVLDFQPDLLIVGYGFNDWKSWSYDFHNQFAVIQKALQRSRSPLGRVSASLVKTMRKSMLMAVLENTVRKRLSRESATDDPAAYHPTITQSEYHSNIEAMILLAQSEKIPIILLNTNFLNDYTRKDLQELSSIHHVPLVDLRAVYEKASSDLEPLTQQFAHLEPVKAPAVREDKILLRVFVPQEKRSRVATEGLTAFGNFAPLALNDRGENGDEEAGDSVWSALLDRPTDTSNLEYTFLAVSPDARRVRGEPIALTKNFAFFHHLHLDRTPRGVLARTPVHVLNYCPYEYLLLGGGDFVHPNSVGDKLIAQSLEPMITRMLPRRFDPQK